MRKPQQYVRYSGLREHDFAPDQPNHPTYKELVISALLLGLALVLWFAI